MCGVNNGWKTEKCHECTNIGKLRTAHYDGNCTLRCLWFRTYTISGHVIFVGLSIHIFIRFFLVCLLLISCDVQIKMGVDCFNIWCCCFWGGVVLSCSVWLPSFDVGVVWRWDVLLCVAAFFWCWYCVKVRCLAMYGLTPVMESYESKFWIWTGSGT
jgi:hypothetical protein